MYLNFTVTVCLGGGDGGDVIIKEYVTDKEFERMKKCYAADDDFADYPGLKRLYKRVCRDAIDKSIAYDTDGTADHTDASCIVRFPDEVRKSI